VLPVDAIACDWRIAAPSTRVPLALSADIERALRATGYSALRGVDIVVNSGVVFLTGRVPSYHMKQLAQVTAMRMPGVLDVCNELDVACSR
jgi:osmotically-inducible protein OsmY